MYGIMIITGLIEIVLTSDRRMLDRYRLDISMLSFEVKINYGEWVTIRKDNSVLTHKRMNYILLSKLFLGQY